jgi:hypothetical protein
MSSARSRGSYALVRPRQLKEWKGLGRCGGRRTTASLVAADSPLELRVKDEYGCAREPNGKSRRE